MEASEGEMGGSEIRDLILDPITMEVMRDPVVAGDGFTYDRAGIERWLAARGPVSMVTGAPMPHALLIPNQVVRQLIAHARPDIPLAPWRPHAAAVASRT